MSLHQSLEDYAAAKQALNTLHRELMDLNPSAARSLGEGMEETLTVHRLHVPVQLRKTLAPILRNVPSVETARTLPIGSVVGDHHGGVTFTDPVATILESVAYYGWEEIEIDAERWAVIVVDR